MSNIAVTARHLETGEIGTWTFESAWGTIEYHLESLRAADYRIVDVRDAS